jgi:hypothetical protein
MNSRRLELIAALPTREPLVRVCSSLVGSFFLAFSIPGFAPDEFLFKYATARLELA